jgi:hypothetical protein
MSLTKPAGRFAARTTSALAFRTGFINMQRSAANFMAVDCRNGPVAFSVVAHFDKSKASGLSRVAVGTLEGGRRSLPRWPGQKT